MAYLPRSHRPNFLQHRHAHSSAAAWPPGRDSLRRRRPGSRAREQHTRARRTDRRRRETRALRRQTHRREIHVEHLPAALGELLRHDRLFVYMLASLHDARVHHHGLDDSISTAARKRAANAARSAATATAVNGAPAAAGAEKLLLAFASQVGFARELAAANRRFAAGSRLFRRRPAARRSAARSPQRSEARDSSS